MVEPDARVLRDEGVLKGLPGLDRVHDVVGSDEARVEVQRVAHRSVVHERDVEGIADVSAQDRSGGVPLKVHVWRVSVSVTLVVCSVTVNV